MRRIGRRSEDPLVGGAATPAPSEPRALPPRDALRLAHLLALAVPTALLSGALLSQYVGDLAPCEMCLWQRWPHFAALALGLVALTTRGSPRIALLTLAALAIAVSGVIGVYHAGVEARLWSGVTACTAGGSARSFEEIMAAPLVRCDEVQWRFLGLSMAAWNAILSLASAAVIGWLLARVRKHSA